MMKTLFKNLFLVALFVVGGLSQPIYPADKTWLQRGSEGEITGYSFVEKFGEKIKLNASNIAMKTVKETEGKYKDLLMSFKRVEKVVRKVGIESGEKL